MRKLFLVSMIASALAFSSCEKDEIGGTATQKVAGEWYVTIDAVDANGEVVISAADFVADGDADVEKGIIRTFNTAANVADQMYISDMSVYGGGAKGYSNIGLFYCFQVPVTVNQETGEFYTANNDFVQNMEENVSWESDEYNQYSDVKIVNGKISFNGGVQNNGSVADAIEFDLYIKNNYLDADNDPYYVEYYGATYYELAFGTTYDHYHVSGIRYSGLAEND